MSARGHGWERVCKNSRDRLAQDGDLCWFRFSPPVLKIGAGKTSKRGSFLAVYTGKAPPDWIALVDGLSVLGDDKESRSKSWSTRNLHKHQADAFESHQNQGGLSVVLLRMHDKSRWVVPWDLLRPYWVSKKYISLPDLAEMGAMIWQIKDPDEPAPYDWLTPLLKWRAQNGDRLDRDACRIREHGTVCDLPGLVQSESEQGGSGESDLFPGTAGQIPF